MQKIFEKINEEYKELLDECNVGNIKYIKEELGDLLFSIVNLARFLHIDSEEALNLTNQKFIDRFEFIEQNVSKLNKKIESDKIAKAINNFKLSTGESPEFPVASSTP